MTYPNELVKAFDRTSRFGFAAPEFFSEEKRYLNTNFENQLLQLIDCEFRGMQPEDFVARCIPVHHIIQLHLQNELGIKAYFTLGYFTLNGNDVYLQTEESLQKLLVDGANPIAVDFHAWLTLPSLEILDITLPTTCAAIGGDQNLRGRIISRHYSELNEGLDYHPMLVGIEYLEKMGFSFSL